MLNTEHINRARRVLKASGGNPVPAVAPKLEDIDIELLKWIANGGTEEGFWRAYPELKLTNLGSSGETPIVNVNVEVNTDKEEDGSINLTKLKPITAQAESMEKAGIKVENPSEEFKGVKYTGNFKFNPVDDTNNSVDDGDSDIDIDIDEPLIKTWKEGFKKNWGEFTDPEKTTGEKIGFALQKFDENRGFLTLGAGLDAANGYLKQTTDFADEDFTNSFAQGAVTSLSSNLSKMGGIAGAVGVGIQTLDIANKMLGKKSDKFAIDSQVLENAGSYQDVVLNAQDASYNADKTYSLLSSGKRRKQNQKAHEAALDLMATASILDEARNRRSNTQLTDMYSRSRELAMHGGYDLRYTKAAKEGAKLEYEDDFEIIINIPESPVEKFNNGGNLEIEDTWEPIISEELPILKTGGTLEKPEIDIDINTNQKSVIPEGALHKNKHHLDEVGVDDSELTKKGIPVVDNQGNQQAEIELNEIIFTLEVTKELERRYKEFYKEDTSEKTKNELALEAGKILWREIIYNTDDRTGLIDSLKQGGSITPKFESGGDTTLIVPQYVEFSPAQTSSAPIKIKTSLPESLVLKLMQTEEEPSLSEKSKTETSETSENSKKKSKVEGLSFLEMVNKYGEGVINPGNTHLRALDAKYGVKNSAHKNAHPTWKNTDGTPMPMAFDLTPNDGYTFTDLWRVLGKPEWTEWLALQPNSDGTFGWGIVDESTDAIRSTHNWTSTGNHIHLGTGTTAWQQYVDAMSKYNGLAINTRPETYLVLPNLAAIAKSGGILSKDSLLKVREFLIKYRN